MQFYPSALHHLRFILNVLHDRRSTHHATLIFLSYIFTIYQPSQHNSMLFYKKKPVRNAPSILKSLLIKAIQVSILLPIFRLFPPTSSSVVKVSECSNPHYLYQRIRDFACMIFQHAIHLSSVLVGITSLQDGA